MPRRTCCSSATHETQSNATPARAALPAHRAGPRCQDSIGAPQRLEGTALRRCHVLHARVESAGEWQPLGAWLCRVISLSPLRQHRKRASREGGMSGAAGARLLRSERRRLVSSRLRSATTTIAAILTRSPEAHPHIQKQAMPSNRARAVSVVSQSHDAVDA